MDPEVSKGMTVNSKPLIVNCFSGPGAGKSTLAARLYSALKLQHYDVEYVNEFAKELVYENNTMALANQVFVFGTQLHRMTTAAQSNGIVICDSPILLSAVYNSHTSKHLIELVVDMHERFHNFNIFIKRTEQPHSMVGRVHSLTQSISIDNQIIELLKSRGISYIEYDPSTETLDTLLYHIKAQYGKETNWNVES